MKRKKEKTEIVVLDVVGNQASTTIQEIDQKTDQEIDVKGGNIVKSMNLVTETDQEKEEDAPEPLAQNIEEAKTSPTMVGGEGTAKRP